MSVEPLYIEGEWNSYPLELKAGQPVFLTIKLSGSLELVNLDRCGEFWARFDGQPAEPRKANNFVIFLSRRFTTNRDRRTICLYSDEDRWITTEGSVY